MIEQFFITTAPNLEKILAKELEMKWPHIADAIKIPYPEKIQIHKGGVELETDLQVALTLNHHLKTANRILLRISSFKCRDIPKLFNKLKKIKWNSYLDNRTPLLEISAHGSRLFDSRKIEKAAIDAIAHYRKANPLAHKYHVEDNSLPVPRIFIRFIDDLCTISIDSSGDLLHKRNYRLSSGVAPIRETLAASLLLKLITHIDNDSFTLLDPMCGSGTFLFEAQTFFNCNQQRNFAFYQFPIAKNLKISPQDLPSPWNIKTLGSDLDHNILEIAKEINEKNDLNTIFSSKDILKDNYQEFPQNALVILNPPYGKRIKLPEDPKTYFPKLITAIKEKLSPKAFGIIIPATIKFQMPKFCKDVQKIYFSNGGIESYFYILKDFLHR